MKITAKRTNKNKMFTSASIPEKPALHCNAKCKLTEK